ncbi:MAG: hypothetical protein H7256_03870 [Bdellovibrio sp.]|nr:hypothetical protein [Bdellovibrio sp.]
MSMKNFFKRRQLLIYKEIQVPILKNMIFLLAGLALIQVLGLLAAMWYLEWKTQLPINIVIDFRILNWWKSFLYLSILVPIFFNSLIGLYFLLHFTNKFAGPLFRLERELDECIQTGKPFSIKFRDDDYLRSIATKLNLYVGKNKASNNNGGSNPPAV